jgi:tRNA (Thr-GGU) A37 N-methylase
MPPPSSPLLSPRPTTLRVGALEAIDGTPIVDLKIATRQAPEG